MSTQLSRAIRETKYPFKSGNNDLPTHHFPDVPTSQTTRHNDHMCDLSSPGSEYSHILALFFAGPASQVSMFAGKTRMPLSCSPDISASSCTRHHILHTANGSSRSLLLPLATNRHGCNYPFQAAVSRILTTQLLEGVGIVAVRRLLLCTLACV